MPFSAWSVRPDSRDSAGDHATRRLVSFGPVHQFSGFSDPYSANIVRHNLTGSLVYSQTRSGLPENLTLVSGFFGNPIRPDYVSGQSPWLSNASWPNRSYNINGFALEPNYDAVPGHVIGTVGRNDLRGPAFFQWDLSGMKNFPLTEGVMLQFRADLFNLLNHPNFANPDGGICAAVNAPSPPATTSFSCTTNQNFGRSGQTIADLNKSQIGNGTTRQAQFSLKVIF